MKNSRLTVFLLVLCFALWGVVNNMSDNLVPAFQRIFTMDQDRAVLVQVAFYGAYAVLALFTSILVEEFSFRTGILIGLAVYVCGALLYIPACLRQSFDFYFIGIFVVAGGCAILEASSNSCILAIGEANSAIRRLNFAQAMNPVGSIVGIFIAQKAILAHLNPATVEERLAMTPEQLRPIVHAELTWICVPYVALCLVMLAIWVYFLRHPIATEMEGGSRQLAPLRTRCMHVGAAILATALPFVLTGILFPNMDKLAWMLCGMIGPLACIAAMPETTVGEFQLKSPKAYDVLYLPYYSISAAEGDVRVPAGNYSSYGGVYYLSSVGADALAPSVVFSEAEQAEELRYRDYAHSYYTRLPDSTSSALQQICSSMDWSGGQRYNQNDKKQERLRGHTGISRARTGPCGGRGHSGSVARPE